MGPVIEELEDRVDVLEDQVLEAQSAELRSQLADLRRENILLRRYLAPQREVLSRLAMSRFSWLDERQKAEMREVADRAIRYLEDLDAARERAAVTQEELSNRLTDQMNKNMYVLTVVASVLLPPSLITGLFGINVGGMPGIESTLGFLIVSLSIIAIAIVEVIVFRRLKWI
jgi:zinc transporter